MFHSLKRTPLLLTSALGALFLSCLQLCSAQESVSDVDILRMNKLKGAFLFNVARLTTWSSSDESLPFTFCIEGNAEFATMLRKDLQAKKLNNRSIQVEETALSAVKEKEARSSPCNLFFIDTRIDELGASKLLGLAKGSTLTVSSDEQFLKKGGMIEVFEKSNKLKFRINLSTVAHSQLRIPSDLLDLADEVLRDEGH